MISTDYKEIAQNKAIREDIGGNFVYVGDDPKVDIPREQTIVSPGAGEDAEE